LRQKISPRMELLTAEVNACSFWCTVFTYPLCNCIVSIDGNKSSPLGRQTLKKLFVKLSFSLNNHVFIYLTVASFFILPLSTYMYTQAEFDITAHKLQSPQAEPILLDQASRAPRGHLLICNFRHSYDHLFLSHTLMSKASLVATLNKYWQC
jgi:hypothetical protein